MHERSPILVRLLLRLLLGREGGEFIAGDLEELFRRRAERDGWRRARWWYWRQGVRSIAAVRLARVGRVSRWLTRRRPTRLVAFLGGLAADARYAGRALRRRPGFTLLAVLTLAVGIGANTTVFAMVDQLLFRPVPGVRDPGRAAYIQFVPRSGPPSPTGISLADLDDLRAGAMLFQGLTGYELTNVYLSGDSAAPVAAVTHLVGGDYFEVMGARPAVGRLLRADETGAHADPSRVVISERLWGALFGRAPDVVGRQVRANGHVLTVIGVVGNGFEGPSPGLPIDAWLPISALTTMLRFPADYLEDQSARVFRHLAGRLAPGASPKAAEAQLQRLSAGLEGAYSSANGSPRRGMAGAPPSGSLGEYVPRVYPGLNLRPMLREGTHATLRGLVWLVGLVLVIACANVANLLLLRGARRRSEVAVRRALGAGRTRVFSSLLVESMLLSLMGAGVAVVVAWGLAELFRDASMSSALPAFAGLAPDWRVLGFALGAALGTGLVASAVPALFAVRVDFAGALRESGRRETAKRAVVRSVMTVLQLGLSMSLLVGAALLTRTVRNLYRTDLGYDVAGLVTFTTDFSPEGYRPEQIDVLNHRLFAGLQTIPGVQGVAFDVYGPLQRSILSTPLQPASESGVEPLYVETHVVTPGYFEILGIPILQGRSFRPGDWRATGTHDIIITRALSQRLFGEAYPVGRVIRTAGSRNPQEYTVIGMAGDVHMLGPATAPGSAMFQVLSAQRMIALSVVLRTRLPAERLADPVRHVLASVAPDVPLRSGPVPLSHKLDQAIGEERLFGRLLAVLSGLAVLLASVGLYGVISWTVTDRTHEIGIRMALGARRARVAGLVLRQAASLVMVGVVLGLVGAYGVAHLVQHQLFGVQPVDPITYAAAALLLVLIALAACLAPTSAATRVDPATALRHE